MKNHNWLVFSTLLIGGSYEKSGLVSWWKLPTNRFFIIFSLLELCWNIVRNDFGK
jgi:hypothetical protein